MALKDILNGVATLAGIANPAVAGGIKLVNSFLPDDKKLDVSATGADVMAAYDGLPDSQRMTVDQQAQIELAHLAQGHDTLRTMLETDARNPHSTRPKVVMRCFWVLAICSVLIVFIWAYAVITENDALVTAVVNGWPMVAAILAPFAVVLRAYFGDLTKEQGNKYAAATGQAMPGIGGAIAGLLKKR